MKTGNIFRTFAVTLLFSYSAIAANRYALYLGAGGEPEGKTNTIFDQTFQSYVQAIRSKKWQSKTYFDGGHQQSEAIATKLTKGGNKQFTSANYAKEIQQLTENLKSGKIPKGSQLLITIDTHGAPNQNQKLHGISSTDGIVNLDSLIALRNAAEQKEVRLAVIDLSCYSGNTINLGTDKTCVISATSNRAYGYNTEADDLIRALPKAKNLEEAFLLARNSSSPSLANPQISTPVGRKVEEYLRFADYANRVEEKLDAKPYSPWACDPAKIKKEIENLKAIATKLKSEQLESDVQQLKLAMLDYEAKRKSLALLGKKMGEMKLCASNGSEDLCVKPTTFDPKMYAEAIAEQKADTLRALKAADPINQVVLKAKLEDLKKDETYLKNLTAKPEYKQFQKFQTDFEMGSSELDMAGSETMAAERKAYHNLYKTLNASNKDSNACKEFQL